MNSKTIIVAVIVVIAVVAAAAVALGMGGGDDENKGFVGVVYEGNGGETYSGDDTFRMTSETVQRSQFTNGDMIFTGWNTKADGTGADYAQGDKISYPEHGYVKLYAQWAYGLHLEMDVFDPCSYYLIEDGADLIPITLNGVPLPSSGTAGMMVLGPEGTVWVENGDGTFTGTNGGTTYNLIVELEGVDYFDAQVGTDDPGKVVILFSYSGNVHGSVYCT